MTDSTPHTTFYLTSHLTSHPSIKLVHIECHVSIIPGVNILRHAFNYTRLYTTMVPIKLLYTLTQPTGGWVVYEWGMSYPGGIRTFSCGV